jgi:hypothetical protein
MSRQKAISPQVYEQLRLLLFNHKYQVFYYAKRISEGNPEVSDARTGFDIRESLN